jgi:hypothetical protein
MDERVKKKKDEKTFIKLARVSTFFLLTLFFQIGERTKIAITKTKEFQMRNFYKLDYDEQAL